MSLLEDLNTCLLPLGIPIETGVFSDTPPDEYLDNAPLYDIQEARLSYFNKGNYTKQKKAMIRALLGADFVITDRRYIGHEDDTGFHHYAIDVAKHYGMED